MNHMVTSKERILQASRNLIQEKGWKAINIRAVAANCNVSVGAIYNYYESKADLIAATVESIWHDIFHMEENEIIINDFIHCINWIYARIKQGNEVYPDFLNMHSMSFSGEDKLKGQELMKNSLSHIREKLCYVLSQDRKVRTDCFNNEFTQEKFVDFVISSIMQSLLNESDNATILIEMIRRSVYKG